MRDSNEMMLHSILYAKSHYEQDDNMKGLRVIVGHYALIDPEYVSDEHLMYFALSVLEKFKPNTKLKDVITSVFRETWKWRKDATPMKAQGSITQLDVVEGIMSELRHMMVKDLPPLPQADPSIYPLRKK